MGGRESEKERERERERGGGEGGVMKRNTLFIFTDWWALYTIYYVHLCTL